MVDRTKWRMITRSRKNKIPFCFESPPKMVYFFYLFLWSACRIRWGFFLGSSISTSIVCDCKWYSVTSVCLVMTLIRTDFLFVKKKVFFWILKNYHSKGKVSFFSDKWRCCLDCLYFRFVRFPCYYYLLLYWWIWICMTSKTFN